MPSKYATRDDATAAALKLGGSHFLSREQHVGLTNAGATCYLNSLLQTFGQTVELKRQLFSHEFSEALISPLGSEEECIPLQLQRLFARLEMSRLRAVNTKVRRFCCCVCLFCALIVVDIAFFFGLVALLLLPFLLPSSFPSS